jgi:hypothetical protein
MCVVLSVPMVSLPCMSVLSSCPDDCFDLDYIEDDMAGTMGLTGEPTEVTEHFVQSVATWVATDGYERAIVSQYGYGYERAIVSQYGYGYERAIVSQYLYFAL